MSSSSRQIAISNGERRFEKFSFFVPLFFAESSRARFPIRSSKRNSKSAVHSQFRFGHFAVLFPPQVMLTREAIEGIGIKRISGLLLDQCLYRIFINRKFLRSRSIVIGCQR